MSVRRAVALTLAVLCLGGAAAVAAPRVQAPEDRLLPVNEHRTEKARQLARSYQQELRELNAEIYHCMPWLEVEKEGIGFYKPRHVAEDQRYLSLRVYIEQNPAPEFVRRAVDDRAAAMFSRYVHPLLRRMLRTPRLVNEAQLEGFNLNLEWLRETPRSRAERPVHEGIQVFIHRLDAADFLAGRMTIAQLAHQAHIRYWEGETLRGPLNLAAAWDDDFVSTFKVNGYEPPAGVACR